MQVNSIIKNETVTDIRMLLRNERIFLELESNPGKEAGAAEAMTVGEKYDTHS